MNITITHVQGEVPVSIIRAEGKFDASSADYFKQRMIEEINSGAYNLLLDMSEILFMSSAGIRSLYALYNQLHPKPAKEGERSKQKRAEAYKAPHMKILNPTDRTLYELKMVGIDNYIEIFDDEESAIAAFTN